jgi:hypothetical protein
MDRPVFHKNDVLKWKRIAVNERVRRNLKYIRGKMSARLGARSFERREGRRQTN